MIDSQDPVIGDGSILGPAPIRDDVRVIIQFRRPKNGDTGYIGAGTSYAPRPGETWSRGNDLVDGEFSEETLERIFDDIRAVYRGDRK